MYQSYVNRLVAWYVGSMAVCVKMQEELEETLDDDMTEKRYWRHRTHVQQHQIMDQRKKNLKSKLK